MACVSVDGSSWKAVPGDRRSRMNSSSMHAPDKKEGGGSRNWGSSTEVDWYDPVGINGMTKVQTGPSDEPTVVMNGAHKCPKFRDIKAFPTLSSATHSAVRVAAENPSAKVGQYTSATRVVVRSASAKNPADDKGARGIVAQISPGDDASRRRGDLVRTAFISEEEWQLVLDRRKIEAKKAADAMQFALDNPGLPEAPAKVQDALRTSVTYNSTHPRNVFARRPRARSADAARENDKELLAIDWSGSGTRNFTTQMIRTASNNPDHVSAFATHRLGPDLDMVKAVPAPVQYVPKITKQHFDNSKVKFGKPQIMVQRKC